MSASHLWKPSGEFLTLPHTAAALQMESAMMRRAKEIRSGDQGCTQQGGDWFTVHTVSHSIGDKNPVAKTHNSHYTLLSQVQLLLQAVQ